jgi:hypothetical protein
MRFEIEIQLNETIYEYTIAFELPEGFNELRVFEEKLVVAGKPLYTRKGAQVSLSPTDREGGARFRIDWHLVALPIVQEEPRRAPLVVFKEWLSSILILRPIPSLISGDSTEETIHPNSQVSDFGAWFSGLLHRAPFAVEKIGDYLRQVMPDFKQVLSQDVLSESRQLIIQFAKDQGSLKVPFRDLSDGEKCFMICAMVLATNSSLKPMLCFWDEPDSHLALSEVGHFVLALRKSFEAGGQLIATSHNPEAIRRFSEENTLVFHRKSHLEPTVVRRLDEIQINGDIVNTLIRGDLEP